MPERREAWWVRLGADLQPAEIEFGRDQESLDERPVRVWMPGGQISLRPDDVVMIQRIAPPQETSHEAAMALATRIVRTLDALSDRYDDYDEREPLVGEARKRYSALKSAGRDFTTSSAISRAEMVAALIARAAPAVDPGTVEIVTREMLDACRVAMKAHIEAVPEEDRERRWGKPRAGRGYPVPEDEKAEVRYLAMRATAPKVALTAPAPGGETDDR